MEWTEEIVTETGRGVGLLEVDAVMLSVKGTIMVAACLVRYSSKPTLVLSPKISSVRTVRPILGQGTGSVSVMIATVKLLASVEQVGTIPDLQQVTWVNPS